MQTRVRGINNRGQLAIDTVDGQLKHHSFVLDNGRFAELTPRGAPTGSLATDIDDRGRPIGWVPQQYGAATNDRVLQQPQLAQRAPAT